MTKLPIAILCGGKGVRLHPQTLTIPKALIPVKGEPILAHILRLYMHKGFDRFILCTGHKSALIEDFCESFENACEIRFSNAGENASMLERISQLWQLIDDRVIVSYGDTLTDLDLDHFLECHRKSASGVAIVTANIRSPFGLVEYDAAGKVLSLIEKPVQQYYIGHSVFSKSALENISSDLTGLPDGEGLIAYFQQLIQSGKLLAYEHKGFQITFNTESDLAAAEAHLKNFYTIREE